MSLSELCELAINAGYDAICMRASQIGVHSSADAIAEARETIARNRLEVTMISGDFDIVYNNSRGPNCLSNITRYLDLADQMGANLVRVCIKSEPDIAAARRAADEAAERGVTLLHQCHVQSLFETVDQIEARLKQIDRANFGLIYEAANLQECRQDYGLETIQRLAPWIRNVYLQNQRLDPNGSLTLDTWTHGPISLDVIGIPEPGGIDFPLVLRSLQSVGYDGIITVHQSAPCDGSNPIDAAMQTAAYLRKWI